MTTRPNLDDLTSRAENLRREPRNQVERDHIAMNAAIRAVLAVHRPQIIDTVPGDCAAEECEHDEPAECPRTRFAQCVECDRIARESYAYYSETGVETTGWPCATVRAIAVHVEVDQSGAIPSPTGPEVVCLCGSTRFAAELAQTRAVETLAGRIVLGPEVLVRSDPAYSDLHDADAKDRLDELHLAKIDLADRVIVICPGDYIGDSTRAEIEHAKRTGKPIECRTQIPIPGRCRECGCTDDQACFLGCSWGEPDLCSSCTGEPTGGELR